MTNEAWLDLNANSLQDPLEVGIENLSICMTNQAPILLNGVLQPVNTYQDTVLTDAAGIYVFENLPGFFSQLYTNINEIFHKFAKFGQNSLDSENIHVYTGVRL